MKQCPRCKRNNAAHLTNCAYCHQPLAGPNEAQAHGQYPREPLNANAGKRDSPKNGLGKILVSVLVVVVIVVAVIIAVPLITRSTQQNNDNAVAAQPTSTSAPTSTSTVPVTEKMPPTETNCPANGQARPMVSASLAKGKRETLLYFDSSSDSSSGGTRLNRYDASTHQTSVVLSLPNTKVTGAQVSGDGQWVTFLAWPASAFDPNTDLQRFKFTAKLQVVRADGQGLQTLYCADATVNPGMPAWSPDGKQIAFAHSTQVDSNGSFSGGLYILNTTDGSMYDAYPFQASSYSDEHVEPLTWIDTTHLAVEHKFDGRASHPPPAGVYLLDTAQKHVYTAIKQLTQLVSEDSPYCWSYGLAPDMKTLYSSDCPGNQGGYAQQGTSKIVAHNLSGDASQTILSKSAPPVFYIKKIIAVTQNTPFFEVVNARSDGLVQPDGIWRANLDGSDLKQAFDFKSVAALSDITTPWSSASRDGHWLVYIQNMVDTEQIALQVLSSDTNTVAKTLITIPAQSYSFNSIQIAGWTQL